jgi:hypothetical protein
LGPICAALNFGLRPKFLQAIPRYTTSPENITFRYNTFKESLLKISMEAFLGAVLAPKILGYWKEEGIKEDSWSVQT